MVTFQEILQRLTSFWEKQGCVSHLPYDNEKGAGTFNPATFLRVLGPEPYRACHPEPCRRPSDGRYGENPNRTQHFFQFQVILKPPPETMLALYLQSLEEIGFDLSAHDVRFVEDDWESPTLGASGLGWEVWIDGMEVSQFTYFQTVGGQRLHPITGEITYGLERLALYLQNKESIFDIQWSNTLTYGDIYLKNEQEWSCYNFEEADPVLWKTLFTSYEQEATRLIEKKLVLPAYDFVIKCSHAFNVLDARGVISVSERAHYIGRIRNLAKLVAKQYVASRERLGFPLCKKETVSKKSAPLLPLPAIEKTAPYLLEIGTEELPAHAIQKAGDQLKTLVTELLEKEKISYQSIKLFATPRRLAVYIEEMAATCESSTEKKRGPALANSYKNGMPTQAALGFATSAGLDVTALTTESVKGIDYLFATITSPAKSSGSILQERLPNLIRSIRFKKSMRWDDSEILFARPIRWLLSLWAEHEIPFSLGHLTSGRLTWGHRQLTTTPLKIDHADQWQNRLAENGVIADPLKRYEMINKGLEKIRKNCGTPLCYETLIDQIVYITEYPHVTLGAFDPKFLRIPAEVLISEMVEHQKVFPLAQEDGRLLEKFALVTNLPPTEKMVHGNQRVISARLADGTFLYEKDLKLPLEAFCKKLDTIAYLPNMGSLKEKSERLQKSCDSVAPYFHCSKETLKRAAQLCKADLASDMVFEFPELQGIIGAYYAKAHGESSEVATAISEHWIPQGTLPQTDLGAALALIDRCDHLLCAFSGGLKPTSSNDPYGLRRACLAIIRLLLAKKIHLPLDQLLTEMAQRLPKPIAIEEVVAFFTNRIKTIFLEEGLTSEEVEASLTEPLSDIYDLYCRVQALNTFGKTAPEQLNKLCEVYKRAKGQIQGFPPLTCNTKHLTEPAEKNLAQQLLDVETRFKKALDSKNYQAAYAEIAQLQHPLSDLFDQVRILDDNPSIRDNRIALLQRVFTLFTPLIDFSLI